MKQYINFFYYIFFRGPEARFRMKKGVIWTRVGYTGGKKKWPTYHSIGKHTEAVQIKYDPKILTYDDLLNEFFEEHSYYSKINSTQYKSGCWYNSDEQYQKIQKKVEQIKTTKKGIYKQVHSTIEPLGAFYKAEEYHQQYYSKKKW